MARRPKGPRTRLLSKAPVYTLEILGRVIPVTDAKHASLVVSAIRDRSGAGASEIGSIFPVREGGVIIGYVSYNGKVWKGHPDDWKRAELVYDPYAEA